MPLVRVIVDMEAAGMGLNEAILNAGELSSVAQGRAAAGSGGRPVQGRLGCTVGSSRVV